MRGLEGQSFFGRNFPRELLVGQQFLLPFLVQLFLELGSSLPSTDDVVNVCQLTTPPSLGLFLTRAVDFLSGASEGCTMNNIPCDAKRKKMQLWTAVSGLLALISRAYRNFSLWHHEAKMSAALVVLN